MTKVKKKPRTVAPLPERTPGLRYSAWGTETVPYIRNFLHARKHFDFVSENQKPYIGTNLYAVGKRSLSNRQMAETSNGGVAFYYQGDHCCTYNPDGTVLVQAFSSQRSGGLDRMVLPDGVWQDQFNRTGPCIVLGSDTATYEVRWFWSEARDAHKNKDVLHVVRARQPVLILKVGAKWMPVETEMLEPFTWRCLDRSASLKVSRKAGLPDLVTVIKACNAMEVEMPAQVGDQSWRGSGAPDNYARALELVEAGDYLGATAYLRRAYRQPRWDPPTGTFVPVGGEAIVSTEFERLRTLLYQREGVLVTHSEKIVTWHQHSIIESNLKRFS